MARGPQHCGPRVLSGHGQVRCATPRVDAGGAGGGDPHLVPHRPRRPVRPDRVEPRAAGVPAARDRPGVQGEVGARQAPLRAVPDVPREPDPRRAGQLDQHPAGHHQGPQGVPAGDDRAVHRRRPLRARDRRAARRRGRHPARERDRSRGAPAVAHRCLAADLLARHGVPRRLLRDAPLDGRPQPARSPDRLAAVRHRVLHGGQPPRGRLPDVSRRGRAPDPAGARARELGHGAGDARDARLDARRARPGLRADGAGQGTAGGRHDRAARAAQRADPDGDRAGPGLRRAPLGGGDDRDDLRLAGARAATRSSRPSPTTSRPSWA